MPVCVACVCLVLEEANVRSPRFGVVDSCEPSVMWGLVITPGSLQTQQMLRNAEPSLRHLQISCNECYTQSKNGTQKPGFPANHLICCLLQVRKKKKKPWKSIWIILFSVSFLQPKRTHSVSESAIQDQSLINGCWKIWSHCPWEMQVWQLRKQRDKSYTKQLRNSPSF